MYYDDMTIPAFTPSPGDTIREYKILEKIGGGGMATVYKARHTFINQIVAIKIMKLSLISDPQFCERFIREAQTQAQLTGHQNIVTIHNFIEEGGVYLIVMEYIDGIEVEGRIIRTLAQQIKNFGAMEISYFNPILKGILSGLSFAHEHGIIHRDIKPSNILFSHKGIAKIVDFGIAQIISDQRLTRTGIAVGTPKYMSPEQIRGKELDARSDIYSLGITIYEALTGKAPFDGDTDYEIMRKHEDEEPISPKKLNSRIPDVWEDLILRCITKNPDKRPQNCKEILQMSQRKSVPKKQRVKKMSKKKAVIRFTKPTTKVKRAHVIPFAGLGIIIILALLYYFAIYSPRHKTRSIPVIQDTSDTSGNGIINELLATKFTNIGNLIAHSPYVENAYIMCEEANLNEIIIQLRKDETEITFIHFTDDQNIVVASSDSNIMGAVYNSNLLDSGNNTVRARNRFYEGGFNINAGEKRLGALYFGVIVDQEDQTKTKKQLLTERLTSIGNLIAHSTNIKDAVIMNEEANLVENITRFCQDIPEISFMHFIDNNNVVIASSDHNIVGKVYNTDLIASGTSIVKENNGQYEGCFSISIGGKNVGALYLSIWGQISTLDKQRNMDNVDIWQDR